MHMEINTKNDENNRFEFLSLISKVWISKFEFLGYAHAIAARNSSISDQHYFAHFYFCCTICVFCSIFQVPSVSISLLVTSYSSIESLIQELLFYVCLITVQWKSRRDCWMKARGNFGWKTFLSISIRCR